jgi:hypothetical protein
MSTARATCHARQEVRFILLAVALIAAACSPTGTNPSPTGSNPYDDAGRATLWSGPLAWMRDPSIAANSEARSIRLLVAIPTCGSHATLTPEVEYRPNQIAIEMRMDDLGNCLQAGGPTYFDVELNEPVGQRNLVDLTPAPAWPYRSLDEWGRIPNWSEIAPQPTSPIP